MTDPPSVSILTRFVLENPHPLGLLLAIAAAVAIWPALREGRWERLRVAGPLLALAVVVVATGLAVVTSGEHGRAATRRFVERVVAGDVVGAMAVVADDATVSVGSPRNPGYDHQFILAGINHATGRYRVQTNHITRLKGYGVASDEAEVRMACLTDAGMGYTPSTWILRVRRGDDGTWKIARICCLTVNGRAPPSPTRW